MAKSNVSNPRISINKLAEFITVKAGRQREILRDQKYPTDFKGPYYREATEAISTCISSNLADMSGIHKTISILGQSNPDKIGTQRRINANLDALETFESMLDAVDLKGAAPSLGAPFPEKLVVQNVEISVRPEVMLRLEAKANVHIGALKLHFPRTFSLNEDASGYVSAILQRWCADCLPDDGVTSAPLCFVIDVGAKNVWPGVKATAKRMKDVEAYCQNIAALWPTIGPND